MNSARRQLDAEDEAARREAEQEELKKMRVPCFGRVYKRQMYTNLVIALLVVLYILLLVFTS